MNQDATERARQKLDMGVRASLRSNSKKAMKVKGAPIIKQKPKATGTKGDRSSREMLRLACGCP